MSGRGSERMTRRSLLGFLPWLVGCAAGGASPSSAAGDAHPLLGAPAPSFELRDVTSGKAESLGAHAGKVVLVDFWATWCAPCKQSFPAYQKLANRFKGDLVVLAVSQDDDASAIPAFLSETGVKFSALWDDGKSVAKAYDPPSMPSAFVIDKSGIVRFIHVGYRPGDERTLEERVISLLQ
jgi:peroxiredoxin